MFGVDLIASSGCCERQSYRHPSRSHRASSHTGEDRAHQRSSDARFDAIGSIQFRLRTEGTLACRRSALYRPDQRGNRFARPRLRTASSPGSIQRERTLTPSLQAEPEVDLRTEKVEERY